MKDTEEKMSDGKDACKREIRGVCVCLGRSILCLGQQGVGMQNEEWI